MVNITHKHSTLRKAIASARVHVSKTETIQTVQQGTVPKGNIFEFSRAAGLLACKNTFQVIPDCHPLPVEYTSITHQVEGLSILITVEVHTIYKTGVEVEAMHGAAITALTIYDMLKPIDDAVKISEIKLESKSGGKSDIKQNYPEDLNIVIVTVNNRVLDKTVADLSGDIIEGKLKKLGLKNIVRKISREDADAVLRITKELIDEKVPLILITGGTGLSAGDCTPDVISGLIERDVPGLMEAIRNYGQQRTPYAMLGRGVAGFCKDSLLITLPGSPRGATESMEAAFPYILHVFRPVKEKYSE
jgi:cyclic pyranopterin phosphate synthase